MFNSTTALVSLALLALTSGQALAHATWIGQHIGDFVVIHGEGSATNEAYDGKKVVDAKGFDKAGAAVAVALEAGEKQAALTGTEGAAILSVSFNEGWWTEDATGEWHNEPADAHADFKSTGEYVTHVVSYVGHTDKPAAVGQAIEIVPLVDPTRLEKGDSFEVQVLQDGKPLKGVSVTHDVFTNSWELNSTPTDDEGKTRLTVMNAGLNVAQYYVETPVGEKAHKGVQSVLSYVAMGVED